MFVVKIQSIFFCHQTPKDQAKRLYSIMQKKEMANICAVKDCPNVNPNAKYENAVALLGKETGLEESKDTASEPRKG
jgi:hypothetical protein